MENFAQAFKEFDSKSFMGKGGFVWWYGVVEDRNDPLFLGRLKKFNELTKRQTNFKYFCCKFLSY